MGKFSNWWRLNEQINTVDYLDKSQIYLSKVIDDKLEWKWVIVSLYGAIYGLAISALHARSFLHVIKIYPKEGEILEEAYEREEKERQIYNKSHSKKRNEKLIDLHTALMRCCDQAYLKPQVKITDEQWKSCHDLINEFRNNFVHYKPMGWSIEVSGLPRMCEDVLNVFKAVHKAIESNNYPNFSSEYKIKIEETVKCCEKQIAKINEEYMKNE